VLAAGFDPRKLAEEHLYLRVMPHEIQAWREPERARRPLRDAGRSLARVAAITSAASNRSLSNNAWRLAAPTATRQHEIPATYNG
jgi:hypothetical protein